MLLFAAPATGQEIPRDRYLDYVPRELPRIIGASPASERLSLFGDAADPAYLDVAPRDGVDDRRGVVLRGIATRFAPYLVRNTTQVPMDFTRFIDRGESFPLHVDTWDESGPSPVLLRSDQVEMKALVAEPCPDAPAVPATDGRPPADCALRALVEQLGPGGSSYSSRAQSVVTPGEARRRVLFFDFPGHDPSSWKAEYRNFVSSQLPRRYGDFARSYVHPFIAEVVPEARGAPAYELVLQYWFFYPTNDGGNNHEGDWEHLNVVVMPAGTGRAPMPADTVRAILSGAIPLERLVIRRVEYFFHHWVHTLDYTVPDAYAPRADWEREVRDLPPERIGERLYWEIARERAWRDDAETVVETHPLGYIGGINQGTDQVLAAPGGSNLDSHGTYPFPGNYRDIGPGGAAEAVVGRLDYLRLVARGVPSREASRIERYDDPARLLLVPDWERLLPLVRAEPAVRREWAWLVLPVMFGYPASQSPFAGAVKRAETGNLSPLSPPWNNGWNRSGPAAGYAAYEPHRFSSFFALGWQDNLINSWGYLNLTLPTLASLPPFDIVTRVLAAPFRTGRRARPTFFPKDRIPFRFVGVGIGETSMQVPKGFADVFLQDSTLLEVLERLSVADSTISGAGVVTTERASAPLYMLNFHVGRRVVSENSLRHARSRIGQTFTGGAGNRYDVAGRLEQWEYAGSLRYNFATEALQPFVKVGYGLSWYRIRDITFGADTLRNATTPWVRRPSLERPGSLLPNTWHIGLGIEYLPIRAFGAPPHGLDIGVRADATVFTHRLGVQPITVRDPSLGPLVLTLGGEARSIVRTQLAIGLTVGF
ncbi:MAG: hypothetical protein SFU84_06870 [Gemmatimonadales bacterium]|nr:hypothetical protein [Gemmatimonadales bacterium]